MREYRGHIGVYRSGEDLPFLEYETDVSLLPEPDRKELETGKFASSMADVKKIVEDFDS